MKELHCEPEEYWCIVTKMLIPLPPADETASVSDTCPLHQCLLMIFLSASSNFLNLDLYLCFRSLSPSIHSSGGNLKAKQTKKERKKITTISENEKPLVEFLPYDLCSSNQLIVSIYVQIVWSHASRHKWRYLSSDCWNEEIIWMFWALNSNQVDEIIG